MQCPQCGAENLDSAAFCSLCYAKFAPQPAEPVHAAETGPPVVTIVQGKPERGDTLPPEPPLPVSARDAAQPTAHSEGDGELPDSAGARLIRQGNELLDAGMPEAAYETFESAFKTYQSEGVVSFRASETISDGFARSLIAQGRHLDAVSHYLNIVRSKGLRLGMGSPQLAADWIRIGDTALAGQFFEDAEQMYGLALKLNCTAPERAHALAKQAECYDALDRPAEAMMARQKAETLAG